MARVSRRNRICNGKIIKVHESDSRSVALYARISVDDDSDSIHHQLDMLRQYAANHHMYNVKEYVDVGKSGTDFERKGFRSMLDDASKHRISTIIVKDLSRLGRNYMETGKYIEKIWPLWGIRCIAIADKYDSFESSNSMKLYDYAIKNLVNEMYAVDISNKVKSSIRMKQLCGRPYRSSVIPYGYKVAQDIKESDDYAPSTEENEAQYIYEIDENVNKDMKYNHKPQYIYDIDENVAWIVRKIFAMYREGYTLAYISTWLFNMFINTPRDYRIKGVVYSYERKHWNISTISRMLNNKIYTGTLEVHKTTKDTYTKDRKVVNSNERIYIPYAAYPIIDKYIDR